MWTQQFNHVHVIAEYDNMVVEYVIMSVEYLDMIVAFHIQTWILGVVTELAFPSLHIITRKLINHRLKLYINPVASSV